MVQKEQAERSRQRLEQKVKENELRQQLAAKKDRQESLKNQSINLPLLLSGPLARIPISSTVDARWGDR